MAIDGNKDLIRTLNEEFWNNGKESVLDETFAVDFVDHNAAPGQPPFRDGFRQFADAFREAFPNLHTTTEELIAEGDKVASRWSLRATQRGPIMGIPATGKQVTIQGITIDRIADGQIVERWHQIDALGLLQQLEMMPAPPVATEQQVSEMPSGAGAAKGGGAGISAAEAKAVVQRYLAAGDRNDLDAWDEVCAPELTVISNFAPPVQGLDAVKQFTAAFHSAFDPFFLHVEDAIAEENRVVARWTTGGTNTAPLPTPGGMVPPTGKEMAMEGISIVRLVDGRIVEERVVADVLGGMQQLGLVPAE